MNDFMINVPYYFQRIKSLPDDPENSTVYGFQINTCNAFMMVYPINNKNAMPYGDEQAVIEGIHGAISQGQGLIEVKSGNTKSQRRYIYSIIKSKLEPSGMQYNLTMHMDINEYALNIQVFCDEVGMTGMRESVIIEKLINEGVVKMPNMEGWFKDPYDSEFRNGILMNMSELQEYDTMFPNHPLSILRNIVKFLIENN